MNQSAQKRSSQNYFQEIDSDLSEIDEGDVKYLREGSYKAASNLLGFSIFDPSTGVQQHNESFSGLLRKTTLKPASELPLGVPTESMTLEPV